MNLYEHFRIAEQKLKDPSFKFKYLSQDKTTYHEIEFYLPKKYKKDKTFRNFLYITVNGEYMGLVTKEGKLQIKDNVSLHTRNAITAIFENPVYEAIQHGRHHSNCCFCGTTITSKDSLQVGYGPICAEKWGLPWGTETFMEAQNIKEEQQGKLSKEEKQTLKLIVRGEVFDTGLEIPASFSFSDYTSHVIHSLKKSGY